MPNTVDEEITSGQAAALLGFAHLSQVRDLVVAGRLVPVRKVPGRTGARLFLRSDVERLAADERPRLLHKVEAMDAAKAEVGS